MLAVFRPALAAAVKAPRTAFCYCRLSRSVHSTGSATAKPTGLPVAIYLALQSDQTTPKPNGLRAIVPEISGGQVGSETGSL